MMEAPDIIEIEPYLQAWAEEKFGTAHNLNDSQNNQTRFEIHLGKVKTSPENVSYVEEKETLEHLHQNEAPTQVALKQTFTNNSNSTVEKEFMVERESIVSVSTSLEKGYHCPDLASIVLTPPGEVQRVQSAAGLKPVFRMIESEQTNDVKHKIKFSSKTKVPVPPKQTYTASMELEEVSKCYIYTAYVRFRGTVVAKKLGADDPLTGKIDEIFKYILLKQKNEDWPFYKKLPLIPIVETDEGKVVWPMQGRVVFNYLIGEKTEIN